MWTCLILVNVLFDLLRSRSNYFGVFFGILTAVALILVGDAVLWVVYLLVKRWVK